MRVCGIQEVSLGGDVVTEKVGNGSRDARLTVWARTGTHDSTGEEGVEPGAEKTQPPFTGSSPGLRRQLSLSLSGIMSSVRRRRRRSTAQAQGSGRTDGPPWMETRL